MTINIEDKAKIISQMVHAYSDQEQLEEFFRFNDVGIPLAQAFHYGLCTLLEEGESAIEETWIYLCKLSNKDPHADNYENIDDVLEIDYDN
jgi:hypothetical protein